MKEIIYGIFPVAEALKAGRPISRLLISEGVRPHRIAELIGLARSAGLPITYLPRKALDREAGTVKHQGIAALVGAKGYVDADALLASAEPNALLVVMDSIEDPRNLGAIIRSAHCAGAAGLVVPKHRASGLTETVEKSSAGALEYLPIARVTNIAGFLERLRTENYRVLGVEVDGGEVYTDADLTGRLAFVLGGESKGIRRLTRERCDLTVRIPMRGRIGSLNAAVAAGILFFESVRQRRFNG